MSIVPVTFGAVFDGLGYQLAQSVSAATCRREKQMKLLRGALVVASLVKPFNIAPVSM